MKNHSSPLPEAAAEHGVDINQRVFLAVAEKLASRHTAAQFLQALSQDGSTQRALEILAKSGADIA